MKLKLIETQNKIKEYENPYWSDSFTLEATSQAIRPMSELIANLENVKDQVYLLSNVVGTVKELCNDYHIDYDNLLKHYEEIEAWSNSSDEDITEESENRTYIKTVKGPNGTFFKIFKDKDGNYVDENNQRLDDQELIDYNLTESEDKDFLAFENMTKEELKDWLDKNNDRREHSDEFNELWLKVYRLLQDKGRELVTESNFEEIASKSIPDSDGFNTDYTLYKDKVNNKYVCVFGDKDRYKPEDEDYDFETEYEQEAKDWFNSYAGFEDVDECDAGEATQPSDIPDKIDYPQFKRGKKIDKQLFN